MQAERNGVGCLFGLRVPVAFCYFLVLIWGSGISVLYAERIPVFTAASPPAIPTVADLPSVGQVERHGVTWVFGAPAPIGRFVTGDYYVVGPVTITDIRPRPANGRNGSMLNPPPVNNRSGFDDRIQAGRYDESLQAELPIRMSPGDSLVSSISVDVVGEFKRVLRPSSATISPVRSVSILTCLKDPAPPDAFRPSYLDTANTIFFSRNLRRDSLPRLGPVSGTPPLSEFEDYFERPWIDRIQFEFDFPVEYMPDYGREVARAVSMAGLLLSLDYSVEEKETLLVRLVQYGIDLFGIVRAGHPGWPPHGGHGIGRKLPVVLAGVLLGSDEMADPPGMFSEDLQTMYGQGWTGATALFAGHAGADGMPGKIGWGAYEHLHPRDWESTIGEDYRRCCTSVAFVGEALAARLLGLEAKWNHPAFFDYAERWMTEDDEAFLKIIEQETGMTFGSWAVQGQAWDKFVEAMWRAYWKESPQVISRPSPPKRLRVQPN